MTWTIIVLQLLALPVCVTARSLLAVVCVVARISRVFVDVRRRAMLRMSRRTPPRWVLPLGNLLVLLAYGGLLVIIAEGQHSLIVTITSVFGGAGVAMGINHWLSTLFAPPLSRADFEQAMDKLFPGPPLSQASFERAMAEQTKAITRVIADAAREGNAELVVAVQAGNAEMVAAISEMTRQMSALSEDIRALLAARSVDAEGAAAPGDAGD